MVCYYFIEGAIGLLNESESILKFMRIFTICIVVAFCGAIAYEIWEVYDKDN